MRESLPSEDGMNHSVTDQELDAAMHQLRQLIAEMEALRDELKER